ncbi:hypothetical protein V6N11_076944 [Hibiscus sabdariffa]|uniref:Uncharacterized protein n=1 Tax=Hibiscus sabdariffa TaxID=183260 RepID=A0ABR2TBR3_9ROSI
MAQMEATIENSNDKGVVSHDGGGHDKGICEYRRGHTKEEDNGGSLIVEAENNLIISAFNAWKALYWETITIVEQ